MAIPFCEPKNETTSNSHVQTSGDQVDGGPTHHENDDDDYDYDEVDYEAPPTSASSSTGNNSTSTQTWTPNSVEGFATPSAPPSASEQILAWKILALAMCKALKQYHLQHGSPLNTSQSAISVHLYPNGQMPTNMK